MQKRSSEVEDFYILVRELVVILTTKELEVWATVSLSIWNARNRYLFDKKPISTFGHFARSVVAIAGILETMSIEEYHVGLQKVYL